ncbi:MAG: ADP-ribosylglycohydrolase family protein [Desulfopila sp.]|jgi:ADP-ribosylglycohydrolase|nr:ADP-ribosylglycohydrolase family protein [Desulfopila sp.]
MNSAITVTDRLRGSLLGMFIGDALAMPVHWYYNTRALVNDYGKVTDYVRPRNPHPDSILWRSSYPHPPGAADILHDQAQYWGKKDIHYHQFLRAGENTLNMQLARELLLLLEVQGNYSASSWLNRLIAFMTTPGSHRDTYIEEYLRHFFINYGKGLEPSQCGRKDENHIGGFSLMLPLTIAFSTNPASACEISLQHLGLTHGGSTMKQWGELISITLLNLLQGKSLYHSMTAGASQSGLDLDAKALQELTDYPDSIVVGRHFSSACYVEQSVPATLYLALKYQNSPEEGMIANTMCGGDNAGRGAVLGALLGALNGEQGWPVRWIEGLLYPPPVIQFDL